AGTWALPGGHLELGEKLVDAAKRELKEELDIEAKELQLIAITDPLIMPQYIHIAFFLKNYEGSYRLMEPGKCEQWSFFDIDKLPEDILPTHQDIIKAFKEKKLYLN
ncbi:MAG: NUDIX domain-containing protein, partial [Patescibacteria group bacterium]